MGHTKFAPDWCFGLFKQVFRRTKVSCIEDIATVVEVSAEVNTSQLVGTQEGDIIVPAYSWDKFFNPYFTKLVGIKKYQHFRFVHLELSSLGSILIAMKLLSTFLLIQDGRHLLWTFQTTSQGLVSRGKGSNTCTIRSESFVPKTSRIESALSLQHCSLSPTIARTKKNPLQSVRDGVVSADSRDTLDEPVQRWKTKLCVCACIYLPVCYNSKEETPRQSHVTIAQYIT